MGRQNLMDKSVEARLEYVLGMILVVLVDKSIEITREEGGQPEKFIPLEDAFNVIKEFEKKLKVSDDG